MMFVLGAIAGSLALSPKVVLASVIAAFLVLIYHKALTEDDQ